MSAAIGILTAVFVYAALWILAPIPETRNLARDQRDFGIIAAIAAGLIAAAIWHQVT